jgi:DNA-binding response OmpR family regulator
METPPERVRASEILALHSDIQPRVMSLGAAACIIGRAPSCDVVIARALVSRQHARIDAQGVRFVITDMGSVNGTYVNGQRLQGSHLLADDDQLGFGTANADLRFIDPDPTAFVAARLSYDEQAMVFVLNGKRLDLAPLPFRLLAHLYRHSGSVCSREDLALAMWGRSFEPGLDSDAFDQALASLRRALREAAPDQELIKTRRGIGYQLLL